MTTSVNTSGSGPVIQFSGLASGLDTASIISSLMQVEQVPQQQLQTRMAAEQSQVSALQSINSSISGLSDAAKTFMTGSTWTQLAAKTSNSSFSVTASSTSTPASVSVSVTQSAAGASSILSASAAQSAFAANSTYTITGADGKSSTFSVGGTGSVSDIATAINAATKTSGLSAVVIDPTGSSPSLELVSSKTGATSNFTITDAGGAKLLDTSDTSTTPPTGVTTTAGVDAQLKVDGVDMSSASNTLTIMPGVQLTIPKGVTSSAPATSTVSVTDDGSSRSNAMSTFVSQINSVLSTISSATAYGVITAGSAATGGGVLAGNTDLRDIATQLANTIFAPGDTVSLANMGLSVDETGQLTFDSSAFQTAYQADPQGVQDAFIGSDSFISRVQNVAYQASAPANSFVLDSSGNNVLGTDGKPKTFSGTLTATISSMNDEVSSYSDQISTWDDRLATKQAALEKQYADLETQLATLQSQGTWLTSQISSLDGGWSQNSTN